MPYGYNGRILRVNLSSRKLSTEEPTDSFYRQYFGGEGFVAYFLLKEVLPGVDPLSPENKLIFACGPLTGVACGGSGRHSIGGKSPLTGGFGESEAGGYWGAELKMAGFDAVIVEGRAKEPVYLFIQDGKAQLKDARHLWGMKTRECQDAIHKELGDPRVKIAQIGPSGENLVRFACIIHDLDEAAGRTGMGAVMGSKNLKAVACRGHQRVSVADSKAVAEIARWVNENAPVNLGSRGREQGTAGVLMGIQDVGALPTHNWQSGSFDGAEKISGAAMRDTILVKARTCYACPIHCKRVVKVDKPFTVDPRYGGPEYQTLASLGSNCCIDDLKAIAKAHELANSYGVDTIACGSAISFAMECFERGILTTEDTDGLNLGFGNAEAMLEMVERIAQRRGLGDLLAEGTASAVQKIGQGAEDYAMNIKGQAVPMQEPRWKQGIGIGYLVSPTGADHCHNLPDNLFSTAKSQLFKEFKALGVLEEPLQEDDLSPAKIRLLVYYTSWQHFLNSLVCCYFVIMYGLVPFQMVADLVRSVTGWNVNVFDLFEIGQRVATLAHIFNLREGLTPEHDKMPQRFFSPLPVGPLKGVAFDPIAVQKAKETYYEMMGWPGGWPSLDKLEELAINWAAPSLKVK